jgi:hypothetical protein
MNITDAQKNRINISEEEIVIGICGIETTTQIGKSLHFLIEAKALADNQRFEINFNYKNESKFCLKHFRSFSDSTEHLIMYSI